MKAVSALVGLLAGGCAVILAGAAIAGQNAAAAPTGAAGSCTLSSTAGLTTDQQPVAAGILTAAQQLGVSKRGITIAFAVALTESGMRSLGYGDMMGPVQANGSRGMSSSRGAFQQLDAWGPLADRLDPVKSARMFFDGGQAGQRGLLDVPGWESMPMPQAAQAVQQSEFTDGSNFAAQMNRAGSLADGLTCTGGGSGSTISPASYSGVSVTIPNSPHVAAAVRGKVIQAPSPAMARGIAAGFGALGLPYVWGGGTAGGGPDDGCARAGGEDNSCKGLTGFDCSGLTAYVLKQAGYGIPTSSGAQRTSGQSVPYAAGLPGDIVGFPGHVAVYLGAIEGTPYILEASTFGVPVHVIELSRSDRDSVLHRYYGAASL